ncbi:acyltransferase family protein [Microbulbifer sp. JTAC008]|uniref:acyltransferase family protein n=1 Tax=unclassified Microbulbifer TaxID=2619833 RepID=UPI00403987D0
MNTRLLNLDVLRGLAATLVVWQHSSEVFIRNPSIAQHGSALAEFINQLDFGRIGVLCFFLISGFVIPHSLLASNRTLKSFAIRRFFRLYPAYWLSLTAIIGLTWLLADRTFSAPTILANTTMLQGLMGFESVQILYWTLTAELLFYCLCALMFTLRLLGNPRYLLLVCWGALSVFVSMQLLEQSSTPISQLPATTTYLPFAIAVMFCGTLLRYCYETRRGYRYMLWGLVSTFSIPLLVLAMHLLGRSISETPLRFVSSHFIALAIFLVFVLLPPKPIRHLAALGTISYSTYLFHLIVVFLGSWAISQPWGQGLTSISLSTLLVAVTLLSFVLAAAIYWLVERPCMQFGRYLSDRNSGLNRSGKMVGES